MLKAKKDIPLNNSPENNQSKEEQDFDDLIKNWTATSQKLLLAMNSKKIFTDNKNPKSLMAFGAMGAHINLALQALKATGSNQ